MFHAFCQIFKSQLLAADNRNHASWCKQKEISYKCLGDDTKLGTEVGAGSQPLHSAENPGAPGPQASASTWAEATGGVEKAFGFGKEALEQKSDDPLQHLPHQVKKFFLVLIYGELGGEGESEP